MAPPIRPKPKPDTTYTDAVRRGGVQVLRDAKLTRRYGAQNANIYAPYSQAPDQQSDMYDQWREQLRPGNDKSDPLGWASVPTYGRSKEGKYAGWNTLGEAQAATLGRAENRRNADREVFNAVNDMSFESLDQMLAEYDEKRAAANKYDWQAPEQPVRDKSEMFRVTPQLAASAADSPFGNIIDTVAERYNAPGGFIARDAEGTYTGRAPNQPAQPGDNIVNTVAAGGVRHPTVPVGTDANPKMAKDDAREGYIHNELNPWLYDKSAGLYEEQDFAQQALNTPISEYGKRAAAEFGIDPDLAAGWFTQAEDVADFRNTRDLEMINTTGMTNTDYNTSLNQMEQDEAAAARAEQQAQESGDADYYNNATYEATSGLVDADHLGTTLGVAPEVATGIVTSPEYQAYAAEITEALNTEDPATISGTMTEILNAARFQPQLYATLQAVYGDIQGGVNADYIPTDYDVYGAS